MKKLLMACIFLLVVGVGLAHAADVRVMWDPNSEPDIGGYKIYWGTASRDYGPPADVGNVTEYIITGLEPGIKYYIAATAYNTAGYESDYSNEVTWGVPHAPANMRIGSIGIVIINGDATINAGGN